MNALPFLPSSVSLQRILTLVMVSTLVALLIATAFTVPVEAKKSCNPWYSAGCCDQWTPGLQDKQERQCRDCWYGACSAWWTETRCLVFSLC